MQVGRTSETHSRRRGFSLLETVIVLTLIAVIASFAIPKWTASLLNHRVTLAANRVAADLLRAQRAAYSSSASKTIKFSIGSNQYSMSGITDLKHSGSSYTVSLAEEPYQCALVSVWGKTTNASLTFDGFGAPSRGGEIVIACGSRKQTVMVDSVTGTAEVP